METKEEFIITYLHNSGIAIEKGEKLLIIDYAMHTPGSEREGLLAGIIPTSLIEEKSKVYVLVTHRHTDHYNRNILEWGEKYQNVMYIFSDDIATDKKVMLISCGETIHIDEMTVTACSSNDEGISFWIELDGVKIFHAGDMSLWYWESELGDKNLKENRLAYRIAKTSYLKALESVKQLPVDIAFCPVNPMLGGDYWEGARIFCKKKAPKLFVPVHFGMAFEVPSLYEENLNIPGMDVWAIHERGDQFIYCTENIKISREEKGADYE